MKRDLNLIRRQIMRDVEELQHQFGSAQNEAVPSGKNATRDESAKERRRDRRTAATIQEALRMKTAFGAEAAHQHLKRRGIPGGVAERALAGRRDRRQVPDRRDSARSGPSIAL